MPYKYRLIILFLISFAATSLVFKPILKIAKNKNIVDNPDARKLQKQPIPVMGGIAVFFGIALGLCFYKTMITYTSLFPVLGAMIVMLYLGFIDDVVTIRAGIRFLIEVLVGLVMIYGMKCCICNFQGLWGIDCVPTITGVILSTITFVGIVNAINMIDGIDGLSSAFGIMIFVCLGIVCFICAEYSFAALAAVCTGALLPFFLHNVFGWDTKMFIGDGGTMMMGTAISAMVFVLLRKNSILVERFPALDFSRIAFVLAVLSIPIGDTLRVMTTRIIHHSSPFKPDKTHLHHVLLDAGFSHIGITIIEISLNMAIIAIFAGTWLLGASAAVQLYIVIAATLLADLGIVAILGRTTGQETKTALRIRKRAEKSHIERKGIWLVIQKIIDGKE